MTAPKVKVCGVTLAADAVAVAAAGADYLGLNLWPGSKRHVSLAHATTMAQLLHASAPELGLVGLFVDAAVGEIAIAATALGLAAIQLHGDETPADCAAVAAATGVAVWKAIAVAGPEDVAELERWPVDAVLLDAPSAGRGGSGQRFDWALARRAVVEHPGRKLVLAGGLTPATVAAAVAQVSPWAVDVASGVELQPGIKDHVQVRAFVAAARD
jgi:phosphoribosylanthranilate isomerase